MCWDEGCDAWGSPWLTANEAQGAAQPHKYATHEALEEEQGCWGMEIEAAQSGLVEQHHARRCCKISNHPSVNNKT